MRLSYALLALALLSGCRASCGTSCRVPPGAVLRSAPAPTPAASSAVSVEAALDSEDPSALLAALRAGNERYRTGAARRGHQDAARRAAVATSQKPRVAVLACADSRVAPEILFDQGLGDLFVVRVAGNVTSDEITASLEYAVEHLGTRLIVVLGHERCGAVKAALGGGEPQGHLGSLCARLAPAVAAVAADAPNREDAAIAANARLTAEALAASEPILEEAVEQGHLTVVSAVYDLDTGEVTFHGAAGHAGGGEPAGHAE